MTPSPRIICSHCQEHGTQQQRAPRIAVCAACGFVHALSRSSSGPANLQLDELQKYAPAGLLRERYQLLEEIGRGAQGRTILARHEFLDLPCVVKVLESGKASKAAVHRLRAEARAGVRVSHPNVVRVLDCDRIGDFWYFVMEFVDGVDLGAVLNAGVRLTWHQVLQIGIEVARGLTAIHEAGLVHRDIKPANLMLGADGCVRIIDLGVAGLAGSVSPSAGGSPTSMRGTVDFAGPEVFDVERPLEFEADLYSLGATLRALLAPAEQASGVFRNLASKLLEAEAVEDDLGEAPEWLAQGIRRMLDPVPSKRFPSARAFEAFLQRSERPATSPSAPEAGRQMGIALLPFVESGDSADKWLGHALADQLGRTLTAAHADRVHVEFDAFISLAEKLECGPNVRRLKAAAALTGARLLVLGELRRSGDELAVDLAVHPVGDGEATRWSGSASLTRLADLQQELSSWLSATLELDAQPSTARSAAPANLAAQESFALGRQAFLRGDYESALRFAERALERDPQFLDAIGFAGVCLARLGRYQEALERHRRQEALATAVGEKRLAVEALANIGVAHYFDGNTEAACELYRQAGVRAAELGLTLEAAQINNNLGFALFKLGRLAEAEQVFQLAIQAQESLGILVSLVGPYMGMGRVLCSQQRYQEAEARFRRALALANEVGDRVNIGVAHAHLGNCARLLGRFSEAKSEFALALTSLEETSFWSGTAQTYEFMAEMHIQLCLHDEAVRCGQKLLDVAARHGQARLRDTAERILQAARGLKMDRHTDSGVRRSRQPVLKPNPVSFGPTAREVIP